MGDIHCFFHWVQVTHYMHLNRNHVVKLKEIVIIISNSYRNFIHSLTQPKVAKQQKTKKKYYTLAFRLVVQFSLV